MKKNQIIRLVCFALCLLLVVGLLGDIFHYDKAHMRNRLYTYRTLNRDTVDAVYVGTSGVHCFWVTGQAFHDYGQTVYPCTINGMCAWQIIPMIEYARKTQNPELFLIDIRPFVASSKTASNEAYSRYFTELLPLFSPLRYKLVNRSLKYLSRINEDINRFELNFYLPIFRYHTMWEDGVNFDIIKDTYSDYFGYLVSNQAPKKKKLPASVMTDEEMALEDFAQECLDELIEYAEKEGIELLFVNSPRYISEDVAKRNNTILDYLDAKGIPFFDCCTEKGEKTYPFNKKSDFYDKSHTNYYGAAKYTEYLSSYLDENYDLPDRRNDASCSKWEKAYKKTLKALVKEKGVVID